MFGDNSNYSGYSNNYGESYGYDMYLASGRCKNKTLKKLLNNPSPQEMKDAVWQNINNLQYIKEPYKRWLRDYFHLTWSEYKRKHPEFVI